MIDVRVLSAVEARGWVHGWPTHLISLLDPSDTALVARSPRPDLEHLVLLLADVTDPDHPDAPTRDHVRQLLACGAGLTPGARLLVHCRGGIGRSSAAAIVALVASGEPAHEALEAVLEVRPQAKPNPLLLLLADELRAPPPGQGMFAVWAGWASRQDAWWPVPNSVVRDAVAGRLSQHACVELAKAQTHRKRDVDTGRWR